MVVGLEILLSVIFVGGFTVFIVYFCGKAIKEGLQSSPFKTLAFVVPIVCFIIYIIAT